MYFVYREISDLQKRTSFANCLTAFWAVCVCVCQEDPAEVSACTWLRIVVDVLADL